MPRLDFGDFLNLDSPRGRGRARGRGRGGFQGGRGGGAPRGGGGGRGGRGGRGGFDSSRGRGAGRTVRGGHFGADYSAVALDYSKLNTRTYHKFEPSVKPFGPGEGQEQEQREMPRRVRSFAPHGPPSGPGSGSATPITSGIGYHRRGPRTAAREVGGVVTWGGGGAPLFVKAGELFRDGEVDVVKRQGDIFIVEHFPLSDPSAPQMHDLHDDVEVDVVDPATSVKVLSAVAAHRHETGEHDDDVADDEVIERMLSDHIQMLAVDDSHSVAMETAIFVEHEEMIAYSPSGPVEDSHAIVAETAIIVEHEEIVPYSPSAPVGVLGTSTNPPLVDGGEEENVHAMLDDDLFAIDTAGVGGMVEMADDDLFAIDTTGAAPGIQILYNAPTQLPLAPKAPPKPTIEEETIIFQPRIIEDPVASSSRAARPATDFELTRVPVDPRIMMSRKERKKAKKEKRSRNKRARRKIGGGNGDLHLASDGSDLDWGSDGPPKILSAAAGDPVGDEELDPELDDETLARYLAGTERIREDNAAMAYMDSESDEWDDEDMEVTRRELAARPDTDSEDDSDDESTENDFNALADAYSEDEFASDGEAKMFSGVTKWNDSDDDEAVEIDDDNAWFIDSMEAALDGGAMAQSRKERKAVFRAVANGSFDTDFPLAPAKRNKKAPTHLPQELQDQWARDRAKKADKKRERELQRAIALLDPSIGFGRKANKKGKGKAAAARIAHLIPGSAAEVAELFDISDDEADPTKGWGIKYHRSNPLLPPTLGDIDLMIQDFLSDAGRTTLQLPPMDKETRKKVHMLAECYDLKSKSKGKGVGRFPILIKLARSGMDVNAAKRDRLVAAGQLNGGSFYKALYARKSKREGEGKNKFARGTGASVRAREGDLVGEGAEKIGEDNVGHKLLSKMGWSEGVTIGISGGVRGLETPIVAVVKNTKRGLGSYGMGYGPGPSGYSSGAAH